MAKEATKKLTILVELQGTKNAQKEAEKLWKLLQGKPKKSKKNDRKRSL